MNQQRLGEIKKHLQVLVSTFGPLVESERTADILGECIIELDRLTAENQQYKVLHNDDLDEIIKRDDQIAALRAEVERLETENAVLKMRLEQANQVAYNLWPEEKEARMRK